MVVINVQGYNIGADNGELPRNYNFKIILQTLALAPSRVILPQCSISTTAYAETQKLLTYGLFSVGIDTYLVSLSCESLAFIDEWTRTFIKTICTHVTQFSPWINAAFYRSVSFYFCVILKRGTNSFVPIMFSAPSFKPSHASFLSVQPSWP